MEMMVPVFSCCEPGLSVFWTLASLVDVWWCLIVALIYISLVIYDVLYLFICHLFVFFDEVSVMVFG